MTALPHPTAGVLADARDDQVQPHRMPMTERTRRILASAALVTLITGGAAAFALTPSGNVLRTGLHTMCLETFSTPQAVDDLARSKSEADFKALYGDKVAGIAQAESQMRDAYAELGKLDPTVQRELVEILHEDIASQQAEVEQQHASAR